MGNGEKFVVKCMEEKKKKGKKKPGGVETLSRMSWAIRSPHEMEKGEFEWLKRTTPTFPL